jgi:hypothetical protein
MVVNLSGYVSLLNNLLRKDSFLNYRTVRRDYPDGSSNNEYEPVITEPVACSFHPENTLIVNEVEGKPVMNLSPLIVTHPDADLVDGDGIRVIVRSAAGQGILVKTGTVGSVTHYQTHIEANIDVEVKP